MKFKLAILCVLSVISLSGLTSPVFAGNDDESNNIKQESDEQFVRRNYGPQFEPVGNDYRICPSIGRPCYTLTDYRQDYTRSGRTICTDLVTLAKEDNSGDRIIINRVHGDCTDVSNYSWDHYAHLTKEHLKEDLKDKK